MTLEMRWGMTFVLRVAARGEVGLPIGSPLAAGGASLGAAHKEEMRLRREHPYVVSRFKQQVFLKRWMDDVLRVFPLKLDPLVAVLLRDFRHPFFYGSTLKLVAQRTNEAFGFRFASNANGTLEVRNRAPYLLCDIDEVDRMWRRRMSTVHGGEQFRSQRVEASIASGYIARYLDTTNSGQTMMMRGLVRLLLELQRAGTSERHLKSALRKANPTTAGARVSALRPLKWALCRREAWMMAFDKAEALRRKLESLKLRAIDGDAIVEYAAGKVRSG